MLEAMFDVPQAEKSALTWDGDLPLEREDMRSWRVGLIVGASGCGKSTILRECFGDSPSLDWRADSVLDDFRKDLRMEQISEVCQAVGFNTIPAWMRPYNVLSNGERFRVDMARRLIEAKSSVPIVMDEFTSVVDRQVAQIGAHAVQKYVRGHDLRFVAASCHYDIVDWLQPDWILEPATMNFRTFPRGCLRQAAKRSVKLECVISRVPYAAWKMFSPFHYMSADLHTNARCFGLWIGDRLASFAGVIHRPHATAQGIKGVTRLVTLPDWQGLGLAMILCDTLGACYSATGRRLMVYPAHPALIRSFDNSAHWEMRKKPGIFQSTNDHSSSTIKGVMGDRPCAVFEYVGPNHADSTEAARILGS